MPKLPKPAAATMEDLYGEAEPTAEALLRDRIRALIRERPLLVVVAAGAVGVTLGGLLLGRAARLAFFGALGFVANELWRSEGRFEILRRLSAP